MGEDSEKPGGDAAEEENTSERDSITDTVEDTDEDDSDDVRYQDDYYEFVNKNLLSKIELAATDAHWDWFGELNAVVSNEMENITEELANDGKTYEKGSSEQKIKDMYECVTNMDNRNETGLECAETAYGQYPECFQH